MRPVFRHKLIDKTGQALGLDRLARRGHRLLNERAGAEAHHLAQAFRFDGGSPLLGEDGVEGAADIWRGIDQRAIEIEQEDGHQSQTLRIPATIYRRKSSFCPKSVARYRRIAPTGRKERDRWRSARASFWRPASASGGNPQSRRSC